MQSITKHCVCQVIDSNWKEWCSDDITHTLDLKQLENWFGETEEPDLGLNPKLKEKPKSRLRLTKITSFSLHIYCNGYKSIQGNDTIGLNGISS